LVVGLTPLLGEELLGALRAAEGEGVRKAELAEVKEVEAGRKTSVP